jgi:hypothetical protein
MAPNTPQFYLPTTSVGTAATATITETINNAREIQFALKLIL